MVRRVLFPRVNKHSRKAILPSSSISLVNWMLVLSLFKCSLNSSILLLCTAMIVSSTPSLATCEGLFLNVLHDYFSHNNGNRGARSCFVSLLVVFTVVLKVS